MLTTEDEESELRVDGRVPEVASENLEESGRAVDEMLGASAADVAEGWLAAADAPEGGEGDGPAEVVKEALHPQRRRWMRRRVSRGKWRRFHSRARE